MTALFAHCYVDLEHPLAPAAVVSTERAVRLVIFVHGWGGGAYESWGDFDTPPNDDWWRQADLLFVDYPSRGDTVLAAADRIKAYVGDFYPVPHEPMLVVGDIAVRADVTTPYEELVLVGHSMGGLVLRRVMVDELDEWEFFGADPQKRPPVLDGVLRLFSPASAGFVPRGRYGVAYAILPALDRFLSAGSAYADLKPGSLVIRDTRARTERHDTRLGDARSLAANLLWANPELIVLTEKYDTDPISRTVSRSAHPDGKILHEEVCKPRVGYDLPYRFVATGDTS